MANRINKLKARRAERSRFALKRKSRGRVRLSVFRSSQHIYAQIIDDVKGQTLAAASTLDAGVKGTVKTGANIEAAKAVARDGIDVGVINIHTLKPIDAGLLREAAARTGRILTVEDHGVVGGLGSAVLEALADVPDVVVHVHGVRTYGESGTHQDLYAHHRLDTAGITAVINETIPAGARAKAAG